MDASGWAPPRPGLAWPDAELDRPALGVPVPLAVLPPVAGLLLAGHGGSWPLLAVSMVFGLAHVAVALPNAAAARASR